MLGGLAQQPAFAPNTVFFFLLALQKWQLSVCVCMNFLYLFGPVFAPTVHAQGYF